MKWPMELKKKILEVLTPELAQEGFDIVELKLSRFKQNSRLRIFIDSDKRVSIGDCARLSKIIAPMLDMENLFAGDYTLEVSSPGLDRPLETARDFRRRIGKRIEVFFTDSGKKSVRGDLVGVNEISIELETGEGINKVDLAEIRMGKVVFDGV